MGLPAAVPRGTVTAQLSSRGDKPSTNLDSSQEGPRAADHQEMALNGQPHTFALAVSLVSWRGVQAQPQSCKRTGDTTTLVTGLHLVSDMYSPCMSLVAWVAPFPHGESPYQALRLE